MTARERQVAVLLAAGLTPKEIAAQLGTSPRAVHRATENIRAKTESRTTFQAVFRVLAEG